MEPKQDKEWRVDKHIPIAVLVGIFMQFMAFVWYAAKIDSIVEQVPVLDQRVNAIETSRFTPQDAENWRRTIISEIKAEIAPLVAEVTRHGEDIRRNEDRIHDLEGAKK